MALVALGVVNEDPVMEMNVELHANGDGYLVCPRRGQISVEWCDGCPYRLSMHSIGDRIVVACAAAAQPGTAGTAPSALRDVPDLWR